MIQPSVTSPSPDLSAGYKKAEHDVEKPIIRPNNTRENKFKDTRLERESDGCTHQRGDHPEPKKCDRFKRLTSEKKRTSEPKKQI